MPELDLKDFERRMSGALEVLRSELAGLRTGRASAALLEPIAADAYGQTLPLNQLATVSVPDARMVTVQVWDQALSAAVEKSIIESGLGLNPQREGSLIRVPIPQLTEERRIELTKVAQKYAEQTKIAVRNVRRDGMETLKKSQKNGDISQDEQRAWEKDLQDLTDARIREIEEISALKEKEIMQV